MTSVSQDSGGLAVLTPGTVLRGRYQVTDEKWPSGRLCCEGGQGVVYYAIDRQAEDRPCVVKQARELVTSDEVLQRLRHEARQMAELSRAIGGRMAEIIEDFVEDGRFYLVEQRIHGETLQNVFDRRRPLPEREVVGWIMQCCNILQRVHEHQTVHRDISPDNLMVTPVGDIMFVDFGTLREFQRILQGTTGMGKYGYTPPEQWAGNPVVQSDIFSLGATAYYLLTGFLPVSPEYRSGRGFQPTDLRPVFPPIRTRNPSVTPALERILSRALDLDVGRRYPSAEAMKKDLEAIPWPEPTRPAPVRAPQPDEAANEDPAPAQPQAAGGRVWSLPRARWLAAGGAVLAIAAIAALVAVLVPRGDGLLPRQFTADFVLEPDQTEQYYFKVDSVSTIEVNVDWTGTIGAFNVYLMGPDGLQRAQERGTTPLTSTYVVTDEDLSSGERWSVFVSSLSTNGATATGSIEVT